MLDAYVIYDLKFERAPAELRTTGLLGFARFNLNRCLDIDGVQVRITRDRRLVLSWPERRGRQGRHRCVRPARTDAGASLNEAILDALRSQGLLP